MDTAEQGCSISSTIPALSPTLQASPVISHPQPFWPAAAARCLFYCWGENPLAKQNWQNTRVRSRPSPITQGVRHAGENSLQGFSLSFPALILTRQITYFQVVFTASIKRFARKKQAR